MNSFNSDTTSDAVTMGKKKKTRLLVRKGQKYINFKVNDIPLFFADGKLVFAFDRQGTKYLCDENLSELSESLDPSLFFRASRKYLLNIDYIKSFQTFERVKLLVELDIPDIKHTITVSQVTTPLFKKWINNQ